MAREARGEGAKFARAQPCDGAELAVEVREIGDATVERTIEACRASRARSSGQGERPARLGQVSERAYTPAHSSRDSKCPPAGARFTSR
jgi:hypothetical protein